jgi:hypothetical protein
MKEFSFGLDDTLWEGTLPDCGRDSILMQARHS